MARRICPDCKEKLQPPFISCSVCPWTESSTAHGDSNTNRCGFEVNGRRCRYVASIFENQLRGVASGVCRGHFRYTDASAIATLEESERLVPMDLDYSSSSIYEATLKAYRYGPSKYGPVTDVQRALVWRYFPKVAAHACLPRPPQDAEAEAERLAIQNEGTLFSTVRL